jgi:hypothetical protein
MSDNHYRQHAERCFRVAQTSKSDQDKAMLLSMAEAWLDLAQRHEKPTLKVVFSRPLDPGEDTVQ